MHSAWQNMDGHFVVTRPGAPFAEGARRISFATTALDVYPELPVTIIRDQKHEAIGCVLGTIIDPDNRTLPRLGLQLTVSVTPDTIDQIVETELYRFTGSFLFVIDVPGCRRLYLDAAGTKSCVYDPLDKRAASTTMALLSEGEYWARLDAVFYRAMSIDATGWFPAGLTAHRGIKRLTCNHYLDLTTWEAVRHWPAAPIEVTDDPAKAFVSLVHRTGATVESLTSAHKVNVALTSGVDSRLVLASARAVADRIACVTVSAPAATLDVACASELTRRLGLRHKVLPYRRARREQAERWQIRAGHCIAGVNMVMHPSVEPLRDSIFIGGMGGEVGRGFLWLRADGHTPLDAAGIVARLKLPRHPSVVAAVESWLAPIVHFDSLLILDLAYLELRVSSWGFADAYANPVKNELHPMISRANFVAMLSVPPDLRRDGSVFRHAIAHAWPELMALPINKYGDWRDGRRKVVNAVTNPGRVVRKLKQILLTKRESA